jgi:hypothetical protein
MVYASYIKKKEEKEEEPSESLERATFSFHNSLAKRHSWHATQTA